MSEQEKIGKHFYNIPQAREKPLSELKIPDSAVRLVSESVAVKRPVSLQELRDQFPEKHLTEEDAMSVYASIRDGTALSDARPGNVHEWIIIRHSRALYDRVIKRTDDYPLEKVPFLQPDETSVHKFADISAKGLALINAEARRLLNQLNPETDVSSIGTGPAERAAQTALLYAKRAKAMGFTVMAHNERDIAHRGSTTDIQAADIRKFGSMRSMEMSVPAYIADLFTPPKDYSSKFKNEDGTLNLEKVFELPAWKEKIPHSEKVRWIRAKESILADDGGSWGENFFRHSARISKEFPMVPSAVELSRRRFAHYDRLFHTGLEQFEQDERFDGKNLKALMITHEESCGALEDIFGPGSHTMANCEAVRFRPSDSGTYTILKNGEIASAKLANRVK